MGLKEKEATLDFQEKMAKMVAKGYRGIEDLLDQSDLWDLKA
jgi:hypothetical protein